MRRLLFSYEVHHRYSLNSNTLDPTGLFNETQPNDLFVTNYDGVVASKFFATLQFSQKRFKFENAGGGQTSRTCPGREFRESHGRHDRLGAGVRAADPGHQRRTVVPDGGRDQVLASAVISIDRTRAAWS